MLGNGRVGDHPFAPSTHPLPAAPPYNATKMAARSKPKKEIRHQTRQRRRPVG